MWLLESKKKKKKYRKTFPGDIQPCPKTLEFAVLSFSELVGKCWV